MRSTNTVRTKWMLVIATVLCSVWLLACEDDGGGGNGTFDGDAGKGAGCCYWNENGASTMKVVNSNDECRALVANADDADYAPDNTDCADDDLMPDGF